MPSALVIKAIKPAKLRQDVFRLAFLMAMNTMGSDIKKDYQATTATWNTKPKFEIVKAISTKVGTLEVMVGTDNEIYKYVDLGTRPHLIFAGIYTGKSDKKALSFMGGGKPKTVPNVIGSGPGMSGTVNTVVPYVSHPGTKPRNFSKMIEKKWSKVFKRRMEGAMRSATKKSNHEYA